MTRVSNAKNSLSTAITLRQNTAYCTKIHLSWSANFALLCTISILIYLVLIVWPARLWSSSVKRKPVSLEISAYLPSLLFRAVNKCCSGSTAVFSLVFAGQCFLDNSSSMNVITASKLLIVAFVGSVTLWYFITPYIVQPHKGIVNDMWVYFIRTSIDKNQLKYNVGKKVYSFISSFF